MEERDFGYVYREDGIFRVYTVTDPETGDREKTREDRVEGDEAVELARESVPEENRAAFDNAVAKGADPALAAYKIRFPDWKERAAAYKDTVAVETARRRELKSQGVEL